MIREKKKKIQKEHKYKNVEHETHIAVWSKETGVNESNTSTCQRMP